MQTIGARPWASAACSLRPTASSDSPKCVRRSEWPTMTYRQPRSISIGGVTSPVNAPDGSQKTSWAPRAIREPFRSDATAASAVNGGQTTTSTAGVSHSPFSCWTRAAAPSRVRFAFQLPAMMGLRIL